MEPLDPLRERLARVVAFEFAVFREVADDPTATGSAIAVVLAVAAASGLGTVPGAGLAVGFAGAAGWLVLWAVWVLAIQGAAIVAGHEVALARVFRALAFASVPFALAALEWVPLLGGLAWLAKWVGGFALGTAALREVLGIETPRAALLCAAGLAAAIVVSRIV